MSTRMVLGLLCSLVVMLQGLKLAIAVWDKITSQANNIIHYIILEHRSHIGNTGIDHHEDRRTAIALGPEVSGGNGLACQARSILPVGLQVVCRGFVPNAGVVLDLAGGLGRHALWLASRGWRVNVVDISEVAISRLRQTAIQLDLPLDLFAMAATEYQFAPAQFDLIVLFYHLDRALCEKIVSALKPGGVLICKTSLRWDSPERWTPANSDPLRRNEILSLVPGLSVMYHQERPVLERGVVELVGKKSETSR
jgi:SAM-dependent methyltransferase